MQKAELKIQVRLTPSNSSVEQESSERSRYQHLFAHQLQSCGGSSLDPTSDLQVMLTLKIKQSVSFSSKDGFVRE